MTKEEIDNYVKDRYTPSYQHTAYDIADLIAECIKIEMEEVYKDICFMCRDRGYDALERRGDTFVHVYRGLTGTANSREMCRASGIRLRKEFEEKQS